MYKTVDDDSMEWNPKETGKKNQGKREKEQSDSHGGDKGNLSILPEMLKRRWGRGMWKKKGVRS